MIRGGGRHDDEVTVIGQGCEFLFVKPGERGDQTRWAVQLCCSGRNRTSHDHACAGASAAVEVVRLPRPAALGAVPVLG